MRYVVLGAGAIGGVVGGRLAQAGHDATLVARGAHLELLRRDGLRLESPDGTDVLRIPTAADPADVDWTAEHVVLLAVKSQQTMPALTALAAAAPAGTPVVCLQNGITNEPAALRTFADVYGVCVALPASHLEPGIVQAWSSPVTGLLDIGRHRAPVDATAEAVAADFRSAGFDSYPVDDIGRWKNRKLLTNLANAIEVVCGRGERDGRLAKIVRAEGAAALSAAGYETATVAEDRERRSDLLRLGEIGGRDRGGGSTWQSVRRGTGDVETDYLNGEIVLLGRLHDVRTPANELLQRLVRERVAGRADAPVPADEVLRLVLKSSRGFRPSDGSRVVEKSANSSRPDTD